MRLQSIPMRAIALWTPPSDRSPSIQGEEYDRLTGETQRIVKKNSYHKKNGLRRCRHLQPACRKRPALTYR